ncbi:hypothetical protein RF11_09557 [Thelohanellus kitauei]|uniref:Immunoglobulin domain-containing protein n=1 Tax=Thelohanellus kitauei TaxID=669202 RepID=A0A0C2N484_THEKT|nr:hypothetical protein RF11_09557 [Thelohanellus kitauei]
MLLERQVSILGALLIYLAGVVLSEIERIERFVGQDLDISCGHPTYKANKFWLRLNSVTLEEKKQPFVYKLRKLDFIDTGFYTCTISKQRNFKYQTLLLTVLPLPAFKDPKMTVKNLWKYNTYIQYNCELNSTHKFTYKWFSPSGLIKEGSQLRVAASKFHKFTQIYCRIYLDDGLVHEQAVDIFIQKVFEKPNIDMIYSLPTGFEIKWTPSIDPEFVIGTNILCHNQITYEKLSYSVDKDTDRWGIQDLKVNQSWQCYVTTKTESDKSEFAYFEHRVEPLKYRIDIHNSESSMLNLSFTNVDYPNQTADISQFTVEITNENDVRESGFGQLNSSFNQFTYPGFGNELKIDLKHNDEVVGTTKIYRNEMSANSRARSIRILKVSDQTASVVFFPYSGFLHDFCLIKVVFYESADQKLKPVGFRQFYGYRVPHTNAYRFKMDHLTPDMEQVVQFQYKFGNNIEYSQLSDYLSFRTRVLCIVLL